MKQQTMQYCLRMPRPEYEDALDVALVFDMSLNQFFLTAIRAYVESQLKQDVVANAIEKTREARQTGLVNVPQSRLERPLRGPPRTRDP
jgi:hypothetical protein